MDEHDPRFSTGGFRNLLRPFLSLAKFRSWLSAVALTKYGSIYMWNRPVE
jgi:hypothetical protein